MKIDKLFTLLFVLIPSVGLTAASQFRIQGVADLDLGSRNYSSLSANEPVCVYRSDNSNYKVRALSDASISGFYLEDPWGSANIPFSVMWGNTAAAGTNALSEGVNFSATGANTRSTSCNGGSNANIKLVVNNSGMAAVPAGTYTTVMTVTVAP